MVTTIYVWYSAGLCVVSSSVEIFLMSKTSIKTVDAKMKLSSKLSVVKCPKYMAEESAINGYQ